VQGRKVNATKKLHGIQSNRKQRTDVGKREGKRGRGGEGERADARQEQSRKM
jgi:hypothetical protein